MNKKNYSKPETLVVELKHRSYILQTSPEKPSGDPDPDDGSGSGGFDDPNYGAKVNSNDAQYLWT